MKYNQLGRSGVEVSAIALGTATFGVAPLAEDAEVIIGRAFDLGINMIDTANSYGNQSRFDRPGAPPSDQRASAEEIIGRVLGANRKNAILCSKVMEPVGLGPNSSGLSRLHIIEQVEESLRRLRTDYLDIYYAHHPDPRIPVEEMLRAFDDLTRQGKIRYGALSTYPSWGVVDALWKAEKYGLYPPICNQVTYNLLHRGVEKDVEGVYLTNGLALTVWGPLAGGLLAGAAANAREFSGHKRWGGPGHTDNQLALAQRLDILADESGHSSATLALAWLISRPAVASAIVGAETAKELEANAAAASLALPDDLIEALDKLSDENDPFWGMIE